MPLQSVDDFSFLAPQDSRDDQVAPGREMARPDRKGRDQDLTEQICGDDFEFSSELLLQDVTRVKFDLASAVGPRISPGDGAGEGIVLDCEHPARSETFAGHCQNAAASAGVEHRPTRSETARDFFEQTQTHRGRGVMAGSKRSFGRYDESWFGSAPPRGGAQNGETRTNLQRFEPGLLRKMLEPVGPQFLHPAAKFPDEVLRLFLRLAANLQQNARASCPLHYRQRMADPPR